MDPDRIFVTLVEQGAWIFPTVAALALLLCWAAGRILRNRAGRRVAATVCAVLVAASVGGFVFSNRVLAHIDERTAALTFHELAGDGKQQRIADYRGKVVVLNYWATWCPPCRAEMPDLNRLADTYRDRGLVVITVSDEKPEPIEKYLAQQPLTTIVGLFADQAPTDIIGRQAYAGRPTTVLIDRDGNVRRFLIGGQSYERFEEAALPLL
jgi:thiol-disulfide isomerase/thioredoxin